MRPYSIIGVVLLSLGVLAICVHSITYFSHDQIVGPLGFFAWDVSQPHTIFFNPLAGLVAVVVGLGLILLGRDRRPSL
jgi:hypothetical protein